METRHKILLLDDDPDLLETYRQLLAQLPSQPEIHTASSGPRAITLLGAEPFRLLICDLKMPKMDGLQVLSIVRRKYPQLRTVALTSHSDEQFRTRAYALGVDLFWHKPATEQEIQLFLECLESLLGRETDAETGFRGVQSKSLVDIIQLECISQILPSSALPTVRLLERFGFRKARSSMPKRETCLEKPPFKKFSPGEPATSKCSQPNPPVLELSPSRTTACFWSRHKLLMSLETDTLPDNAADSSPSPLAQLSQVEGVEFVLAMKPGQEDKQVARGLEDPERMALWSRQNLERFRGLGDRLQAGTPRAIHRAWTPAPCDVDLARGYRVLFGLEALDESRANQGND